MAPRFIESETKWSDVGSMLIADMLVSELRAFRDAVLPWVSEQGGGGFMPMAELRVKSGMFRHSDYKAFAQEDTGTGGLVHVLNDSIDVGLMMRMDGTGMATIIVKDGASKADAIGAANEALAALEASAS